MARKPFILRASTADPDARVINNLPGRYPTEDWHAYYWDVNAAGSCATGTVSSSCRWAAARRCPRWSSPSRASCSRCGAGG